MPGELLELCFGEVHFDVVGGLLVDSGLCVQSEQPADGPRGDTFGKRDGQVGTSAVEGSEGLAGTQDQVLVAVLERSADVAETLSPEAGGFARKMAGHFGVLPIPFAAAGDLSGNVFELDSSGEAIVWQSRLKIPRSGDRESGITGSTEFDESFEIEGAVRVEAGYGVPQSAGQSITKIVVGYQSLAEQGVKPQHPVGSSIDLEHAFRGHPGRSVSCDERGERESALIVVGPSESASGLGVGELVGESGQLQSSGIDREPRDGDMGWLRAVTSDLDTAVEQTSETDTIPQLLEFF